MFNLCLPILLLLASFHPSAMAESNDSAAHKKEGRLPFKLAQFAELKGEFHQVKWLSELDVEIKTAGSFHVIKAGDKGKSVFRWMIEKPRTSKICVDSDGVVIESEDKKKILQFAQMGQEVGDQVSSLLKLLTLEEDSVLKDFNVKKENLTYLLEPKNEKQAFFKSARLGLNAEGLAKSIVILEKSKDEMRLEFSKLKAFQKHTSKTEMQCKR